MIMNNYIWGILKKAIELKVVMLFCETMRMYKPTES